MTRNLELSCKSKVVFHRTSFQGGRRHAVYPATRTNLLVYICRME